MIAVTIALTRYNESDELLRQCLKSISAMLSPLKIFFCFIYGLDILAALMTGVKGAVEKKRLILVMLVPSLIVSIHFARMAGYVSLSNLQCREAT